MVWQEKIAYIFMLVSRKEPERCADYWPRRLTDPPIQVYGLTVSNMGQASTPDLFFRVTNLLIRGPEGKEVRFLI